MVQERFQTVITGAGISFEPPSSLPSGEELATLAWEVLAASVDLPAEAIALVTGRIMAKKLRLEQLLDVMTLGGYGMPLEALVKAYVAVESDAFNSNHSRLASLKGARHFTVNMDTLLEAAAAKRGFELDITHLHGRWDLDHTISTTISQYLAELPPSVEREFGNALAGKDVLVAGYSARDRDIQPLLLKYAPQSLTWLVYPRCGDNPRDPAEARKEELEPEAISLLDSLRAGGTTSVRELRSTIGDFLAAPLPEARRSVEETSARFSRGVEGARIPTRESYEAVDEWRRRLAVAAVLADQGAGDSLPSVLEVIRVPQDKQDAKVVVAKLRARLSRRQGHRLTAIRTLVMPVGGGPYRTQLRAVANEVSASLPGTRLHWLADPVDRVLASRADGKTEFLIRTRLAQRQSARGDLRDAEAAFRSLGDQFVKRQIGLGNWVNHLTWHADVLKVLGDVSRARELLEQDLEETFYSDQAQSATLQWKLLELSLVADGPAAETLTELTELHALAPEQIGADPHCWIALTLLGATGQSDSTLRALSSSRADTQMFYLLQNAEIARAEGDFTRARAQARQARRVEIDRSRWQGSLTGRLAANLIFVTATAQDGGDGVAKLDRIARRYDRIGAGLPAARARGNAALLSGRALPESVLNRWVKNGWELEAQRVREGPVTLGQRWQIVM